MLSPIMIQRLERNVLEALKLKRNRSPLSSKTKMKRMSQHQRRQRRQLLRASLKSPKASNLQRQPKIFHLRLRSNSIFLSTKDAL